jgi:YidC/Oxa1 family membrane protein insertase
MEKIKERVGDDRQKMQQEMMELYKREKVNPASGCLPILLQIPIFFSLYKVIFVTLELRHAPFFGWFRTCRRLTRPRSSTCSACCPGPRPSPPAFLR